ncbi:CrcB family protein [Egicoccus sp. AB-alg2]|uniref:CrcB family protein n=1 Tax=Egicoccus sp. AB-alg2 TaxID=3242693 RepID=UPI00359DB97F
MTAAALSGAVAAAVGLAVAGALGAVVRHLAVTVGSRRGDTGRAAAIAVCNLLGALALAGLVVADRRGVVGTWSLLVVGTGFCGAVTTFSTWVVDVVAAWHGGQRHRVVLVGVDLVGQLVVGVLLASLVVRWAAG